MIHIKSNFEAHVLQRTLYDEICSVADELDTDDMLGGSVYGSFSTEEVAESLSMDLRTYEYLKTYSDEQIRSIIRTSILSQVLAGGN